MYIHKTFFFFASCFLYLYTGPASYYMGIIDFLQKYDLNKKVERYSKVYLMGKSGDGK